MEQLFEWSRWPKYLSTLTFLCAAINNRNNCKVIANPALYLLFQFFQFKIFKFKIFSWKITSFLDDYLIIKIWVSDILMWHSFPLVQPQLYLHLLLSVFVLSPQFLQYLNASTLHFPVVSNNWNLVTSGHIEEQLDRLKKNKEISMYFLALEKQKKVLYVLGWLNSPELIVQYICDWVVLLTAF